MLTSKTFWVAVGERAVKTFAQSLLATLAVSSVPLDILHVNWAGTLSISLGATLLSVCTSLSGLGIDTPALIARPAPVPEPAPEPAPVVGGDVSPSMGPDLPA